MLYVKNEDDNLTFLVVYVDIILNFRKCIDLGVQNHPGVQNGSLI